MVLFLPSPAIALTNLVTIVCRLLTCDQQYAYPNAKELGEIASNRYSQNKNFRGSRYLKGVFDSQENLHVELKSGQVKGYFIQNVRGQQITAFEGVPFAEPPIGDRRFQPPVPKKPWKGILMANNPGPMCKQLYMGRLSGSENCLNLNVYTKNVKPIKLYPVIVFIHGGFWGQGSAKDYGPSYLLADDVILVTTNYRLGPLGFYTTGDAEAPGNVGLRDQALAIDWVYDNIRFLGGDPEKITLSGSSAGAASAHMYLLSNHPSKTKLKNVISISGSAYNVWSFNILSKAIKLSKSLASVCGCSGKRDSQETVTCLKHIDADVLVAKQFLTYQIGLFIPSIERTIPGAFLTVTPDEAYAKNTVAKIPWLITMTSRELNLPVPGILKPALQANVVTSLLRAVFDEELPRLLSFNRTGVNFRRVRKEIVKFYTGRYSTTEFSQETFSLIATHRYFTVPLHKAIQMHSQLAPTYASIFNYTSTLGHAGRLGQDPSQFGPLHAENLVFFLNSTKNHPPIARDDAHFAIAKLQVNLFGNFATYGEPLFRTKSNEIHRIWEKIEDPDRLRYLWIDEEVKMINDPYTKITNFWENLGIPDMTASFRL